MVKKTDSQLLRLLHFSQREVVTDKNLYVHKTTYVVQTGSKKVWERGREEDWGGLDLHSGWVAFKPQCQVDKQDQSSKFRISMFAENL